MLCTAYTLVTFVITSYITQRSPNRSANINPELNSSNKLDYKKVRFYKIIKKIKEVNYKLNIPNIKGK
ncbi:hypothetical protein MKX08_007231 [Trichoderma sp. CBMAI-0020]|nr:hypothetical protein MKX08_007231 [Trichoderma sp. CBMAI-0020]